MIVRCFRKDIWECNIWNESRKNLTIRKGLGQDEEALSKLSEPELKSTLEKSGGRRMVILNYTNCL